MGFIGRATGTVKLRASFPLTAPIEKPSVVVIIDRETPSESAVMQSVKTSVVR